MAVNTGDLKNRKQTTARLWMQRSGGQYLELGDVAKYKKTDDKGYSDIKSSQKGYRRLTAKLVSNISLMWQFTLNEQLSEVMRLLGLATQGTDTTQAAITNGSGSDSFASVVLGATYFLAKRDVCAVVVTVSGATKTLDVDYTIDLGSGALTILATGSIAAAATVAVAYNCAAGSWSNFTSLKDIRVTGNFKVHEYDQFAEAPRETHDFAGQIWISNQGESDGEKPSDVEVSILVTTLNPGNTKRVDS